jgi:UDP-glucose 4-epimerase
MTQPWLVCGDGFLGREVSCLSDSVKIPEQIHSRLKYAHNSSIEDLQRAMEWTETLKPKVFLNATGPSNVNDSFTRKEYYESEPLALVKTHIELLARLQDPPIYIYLSSAAVYGETSSSGADETTVPKPISPYGVGKLRAEEFLSSSSYSGMSIVMLRVFSSYANSLNSRLPHVIRQKFNKSPNAEFAGTGEELRDFIHTQDLVAAASLIIANQLKPGISTWNVASGIPFSVSDVVNVAALEYGRRHPDNSYTFKFNNEQRPYDPKILLADISKLKTLGFKPKISPTDGFTEYFKV